MLILYFLVVSDLLGPGVVVFCLLSTHFFYATGHHATIPSIRFEAAFIGFHGNWNVKIIPAVLIFMNTYAAETILAWLAPLLVLWPCLNGMISQHILVNNVLSVIFVACLVTVPFVL